MLQQVGCTAGWASGLHIHAGLRRRAGHRAALDCSPPRPFPHPTGPPFCAARRIPPKGAMAPQIFGKQSHFLLIEAFFQTK